MGPLWLLNQLNDGRRRPSPLVRVGALQGGRVLLDGRSRSFDAYEEAYAEVVSGFLTEIMQMFGFRRDRENKCWGRVRLEHQAATTISELLRS